MAGSNYFLHRVVVDTLVGDYLNDAIHGLPEIASSLSTVNGKVDTIDTVVDSILSDVQNGTYGLAALQLGQDGINTNIATVDTVVDTILAEVTDPSYGLSALKVLIDALPTGVNLARAEISLAVVTGTLGTDLLANQVDINEFWVSGTQISEKSTYAVGDTEMLVLTCIAAEASGDTVIDFVKFDLTWRAAITSGSNPGTNDAQTQWYVSADSSLALGTALTAEVEDQQTAVDAGAENHAAGTVKDALLDMDNFPFDLVLHGRTDQGNVGDTVDADISTLSEIVISYYVAAA